MQKSSTNIGFVLLFTFILYCASCTKRAQTCTFPSNSVLVFPIQRHAEVNRSIGRA